MGSVMDLYRSLQGYRVR